MYLEDLNILGRFEHKRKTAEPFLFSNYIVLTGKYIPFIAINDATVRIGLVLSKLTALKTSLLQLGSISRYNQGRDGSHTGVLRV